MTDEQILALAKEYAASYTNRHEPVQTSYGFMRASMLSFARALLDSSLTPNEESPASPADVLIDAERLDWLEAWHDMPSGGKHYGDVGISLITRTSDGWSIDLEWIFPLSEHETLREAIDAAMKAKP